MKPIIGLILLLFFGGVLCANDVVFESGPKKVQLLELFTSEGCSSCPPAEASLGRLVNDPRLWHEFVPVAFHVDYWDRLGWKDPFASAEWTKRQRLYAANWNAESVYTPAFVLNGREWQNAGVPAINDGGTPGVLKATVRSDHTVVINFEPAKTMVAVCVTISLFSRSITKSSLPAHRNFIYLLLRLRLPIARTVPH